MYKKLSTFAVLSLVSSSLFAKSPVKNPLAFIQKKHKPLVQNRTIDTWFYTTCCDGGQEATGLLEVVYGSSGSIIYTNYVSQSPSVACETCTV